MLENIMKDPMFLSAVGAAVGGFIGVVLFFIVRVCIELFRMIPKQKGTYLCAPEINQGQSDEMDGQLLHHHGKRISNRSDHETLGVKHPLWEWTRDPVGRGSGASVIYGPYMTDPTEPGLYTATFIIKGMGFSKPEEITKDLILIKLDVNKTIPGYMVANMQLNIIPQQYEVARRFVHVSDLAKGGWRRYKVPFYSDGQGIWEYRIYAFDQNPDNISKYGENVRIIFDKIIIKKVHACPV